MPPNQASGSGGSPQAAADRWQISSAIVQSLGATSPLAGETGWEVLKPNRSATIQQLGPPQPSGGTSTKSLSFKCAEPLRAVRRILRRSLTPPGFRAKTVLASSQAPTPSPTHPRSALRPPLRLWSNTVAVPEEGASCKEVASMLQACCRLIGGFLLLSPARSPGRAPVRSSLRAASRPAGLGYRV